MKSPREIAEELMNAISKCGCEGCPCRCGYNTDAALIEKALIKARVDAIDEVLQSIGFRYCKCENSEIKVNVLRDEIMALKTKKAGESK